MMEFNQLAAANSKDASDMLNRVMTKDNIGIVALLETNEDYSYGPSTDRTRRQLIVSNVHMAWEPEYSDVKLIQTVLLMQFLQKFRQEVDNGYMLAGESLVCLFVCLFVCLTSITKIRYLKHGGPV
jgi:CCR4-NOT transcription complex subunit 6